MVTQIGSRIRLQETLIGNKFIVIYDGLTPLGPQTAISCRGRTYVLLGDFRRDYRKVLKDAFPVCKKKYIELIRKGARVSPYSD